MRRSQPTIDLAAIPGTDRAVVVAVDEHCVDRVADLKAAGELWRLPNRVDLAEPAVEA